jgi:hypothetical protein
MKANGMTIYRTKASRPDDIDRAWGIYSYRSASYAGNSASPMEVTVLKEQLEKKKVMDTRQLFLFNFQRDASRSDELFPIG